MTAESVLEAYCSNCRACTRNDVLAAARRVVEVLDDVFNTTDHFLLSCRGCDSVRYLRARFHDSEACDLQDLGKLAWAAGDRTNDLTYYPGPQPLSHPSYDLHSVPQRILGVFDEALQAIDQNQLIAAAATLRATLEAAAEEVLAEPSSAAKRLATHRTLYAAIDDLRDAGHINATLAKAAHQIRMFGNEAVHQLNRLDQETLSVAADLVADILRSIFEGPYNLGRLTRSRPAPRST